MTNDNSDCNGEKRERQAHVRKRMFATACSLDIDMFLVTTTTRTTTTTATTRATTATTATTATATTATATTAMTTTTTKILGLV